MKLIKLVSVFAFVLASSAAFAAAPGNIAVDSVAGTVVFVSADGAQKQVNAGDYFRANTRLVTDENSTAKVALGNGTVIVLKPGTTIDFVQFDQNNPTAVDGQDFTSFAKEPEATAGSLTTVNLIQGMAYFKVAKLLPGSSLTVKTHAGNVSVKGTTFYVSVSGNSVAAGCVDGAIAVTPTGRASIRLTSGKSAKISASGRTSFGPVPGNIKNEIEEVVVDTTKDSSPAASSSAVVSATADPLYYGSDSVAGNAPSADRSPVNSAASAGNEGKY